MSKSTTNTNLDFDNLFRTHAGQIVSTLTRVFGSEHLDLVENSFQDTMLKAMTDWTEQGVPDNQQAWLMSVTKNSVLDQLRRQISFSGKSEALRFELESQSESKWAETNEKLQGDFKDDQLMMMFVTCHPSNNPQSQVTLVLKILGGFEVEQIAKAFLSKTQTIEQRIVRAKQKIREEGIEVELPHPEEINSRLESVLASLYLMFNEGYVSYSGDQLIKKEICFEAIRLCHILAAHPCGQQPKVFALLALMMFQASRFKSRVDRMGDIILLKDQDRKLWDQDLIRAALHFLNQSAQGEELSQFHIEAGIASCHTQAQSFKDTDWNQIVNYYEILLQGWNSSVVFLNYAIAVAERDGPKAGLDLLRKKSLLELNNYYLYYATLGELYRKDGQFNLAIDNLKKSLKLTSSEPEQRFILKRITESQSGLRHS